MKDVYLFDIYILAIYILLMNLLWNMMFHGSLLHMYSFSLLHKKECIFFIFMFEYLSTDMLGICFQVLIYTTCVWCKAHCWFSSFLAVWLYSMCLVKYHLKYSTKVWSFIPTIDVERYSSIWSYPLPCTQADRFSNLTFSPSVLIRKLSDWVWRNWFFLLWGLAPYSKYSNVYFSYFLCSMVIYNLHYPYCASSL